MTAYTDSALNVTQKANHRVFVGLGWDPNESVKFKDKALSKLGLKDVHHDLDLGCYLFDAAKGYISHVNAEGAREVDESGRIYPSGDNVEGIGDGDDEQISVELKNLPADISAVVFIATIKSGQSFGEIKAPEIRLADGYSGHNFLHVDLKDATGAAKSAFVFAGLIKSSDGVWVMRKVAEFVDVPADGDWADVLKGYI
jgi:tellurium resistance protein TerZ